MGVYPSDDIVREANEGDGDICSRRQRVSPRALIVAVEPESPADDAGFEPGCYVISVDGMPVRDIIDWRWLSSDDVILLGYIDLDGDAGEVELVREPEEDWGFEFEGAVFDGVKQCRNACTFCFMRQLPEESRSSLTLRDDDFRLSFLAGTFVTLTNLSSEDEQRIIEQCISPLRVSLHVSNPEIRRFMIGKHAQHGLDALERLLAAGIEFHAQIVLVPNQNDGQALVETLAWAYERPGILDVCIVPLGFTKHQSVFESSFNNPTAARVVMDLVRPFQERALVERGEMWVYPADEFYHNAFEADLLDNLPSTNCYGDFEMFEDGVGIIRSFVDDWESAECSGLVERSASALRGANVRAVFIAGCAMRRFLEPLVARGPLAGCFEPLFVKNDFFGGNVDVTGLLCGCDMADAIRLYNDAKSSRLEVLPDKNTEVLFLIPRVVFNDDSLTLDDMTLKDMEKRAGARLSVVSCNASDFLVEICNLVGQNA